MAQQVVSNAVCMCSFGLAPCPLKVLPLNKVFSGNQPAANIMDNKPFVNVGPFGACTSLAFPATASATSAALGVLTPTPCVPLTTAPWAPGSTTHMLANAPALNSTSKLMCNWGGVISITFPGQVQENIP